MKAQSIRVACTMLAIMLLKASEPARGVVVWGVVVVVSDGVDVGVEAGFKVGGREPRPSLKRKSFDKKTIE